MGDLGESSSLPLHAADRPAAGRMRLSRRVMLATLLGTLGGAALGSRGSAPGDLAGRAQAAPSGAVALQEDGELRPAGRVPGELAELVTPTAAFYSVTKNVVDPVVPAQTWRLVVDGEVNRPVQFDYANLLQLPAVEIGKTLECISNRVADCEVVPFGCELISNAIWKGASLADVLAYAEGLTASAQGVAILGADEFSSAIPPEAALDPETILAYEMNGQPLPQRHGAPVRLLVPGRYGMKSAKWVVGIRPMSRPFLDWYGQRNWSQDGIVKTMSRIDVPAPGAQLAAGSQRIAGIAYAGDRGVAAVEYSADDGATWQTATLVEPQLGRDTWIRWQGAFDLPAGATIGLLCRAIDGAGRLQSGQYSTPDPDGATGWRRIGVRGV